MCDYSLAGLPNRLAKEKESLQLHRFPTYSLGFASSDELQKYGVQAQSSQGSWWQRIKQWLMTEPVGDVCAVCIPPGAQLTLHDIPASMQREFGVSAVENVTFTQISATSHSYRDAVRFRNGREVLLQRLVPGQRALVISLDLVEEFEPFYEEVSHASSHRAGRRLHLASR